MNNRRNILLFLRLLMSNPSEFLDRAGVILHSKREKRLARKGLFTTYPESIPFAEALPALAGKLGRDLSNILAEPELQSIQSHVCSRTQELKTIGNLPFPVIYNADQTLALLAYLLCRVLAPAMVVETGVAYGVTSAMILAALHRNGKGVLHSVDLPPIGDREQRRYVGCMVPAEYKSRWHLHLGPSRRVLPILLAKGVDDLGLFIHDSANIQHVQQAELRIISSYLSPGAAILLNNIGGKAAFRNFVNEREKDLICSYAIEQTEKQGCLTGLILTRKSIG